MRITHSLGAACLAALALIANSPVHAGFQDTDQQRRERWQDLQKQIFGERTATVDAKAIQLDAPERAQDAALVPIAVSIADPKNVKALYLVIDDNPSPVAAHFTFGPSVDPKSIRLRVRVNTYTDMRAIVETKDGRLLMTTTYVKASGGCSAPMGMSDEEAMKGIGQMKFKLAGEIVANRSVDATLMIRHPNFNGMQMNPTTRDYTPARYVQDVSVSFDGRKVFDLSTDISLASNPVIGFDLLPDTTKGDLKVEVTDSQNEKWSKSFEIPRASD